MSERSRYAGPQAQLRQGDVTIEVLRGVRFGGRAGEIVALLGPSGSGKSTLLQASACLRRVRGSIPPQGEEAAELDDDGRTRLRRELLGSSINYHHCCLRFNARENVILPQLVRAPSRGRRASVGAMLGVLGLRSARSPAIKAVGGGSQRGPLPRALATNPARAGRRAHRHLDEATPTSSLRSS